MKLLHDIWILPLETDKTEPRCSGILRFYPTSGQTGQFLLKVCFNPLSKQRKAILEMAYSFFTANTDVAAMLHGNGVSRHTANTRQQILQIKAMSCPELTWTYDRDLNDNLQP